jgi:hypothetical protein
MNEHFPQACGICGYSTFLHFLHTVVFDMHFSPQKDERTLELEVVRTEDTLGSGPGRPLFLDARRFIRICHAIERGDSATDACRRELVTYRLFRMHVQRSLKYARRLKQAEEVREHLLREYHIANISKHSVKNVAASMFWLERRYPNEFALRTVTRDTVEAEARAVFDKISMEQLIENAKLAAEIAANPPSGLGAPPPGLPEGQARAS